MRKSVHITLGIAGALAAALAFGQSTRPAAPVSATQPSRAQPAPAKSAGKQEGAGGLEERWAGVLERLGSPEFKEREAAQKEVERATWRDLPALQALAEKQTDVEVKERLLKRVDELQVQMAFEPSPIDLDVQDANLRNVSDALTKATGVEWKQWNWGQQGTFTLHAKQKPLWEIFLALSAQHSLQVQSNGLVISQPGVVWGDMHGAFLFYPVTLSRSVNFQEKTNVPVKNGPAPAGKAKPHILELSYGVLGDPRLKIETCSMPQITSVVDDTGQVIYHVEPGNNGTMGLQGMLQIQPSASFQMPDGPVRTITVKGQMKVSVVISDVSVEVPDMQKQGKTPIEVMDQEIVWEKFEPKNGIINFQMNMQKKNSVPGRLGNMKAVRITLLDASGRQLISQSIMGGWGGGLPGSDVLPIKAIFSIPTRTEERVIPFEFKDLPVP